MVRSPVWAAAGRPAAPLAVALVEDDRLLREEIAEHLMAHDFVVHAVSSAAAYDDLAARVALDLFVIDWNLPGESGLNLSRRLREAIPGAGIVLMTARVALHDRLTGYRQGGADVYLTKPVAPDELVAVLLSLGRRVKPAINGQDWALNLRDRTLQGPHPPQKIRLTGREKTLLVALVQAKDNTMESGALCDLYVPDDSDELMSKHTLEELVARLRKKFKAVQDVDAEPAIKSVWGVGYQLCLHMHLV
jgi:DNA-binding response OmpR family regulator